MAGDHAGADDRAHLERAVLLAAQGPAADPNPQVGAVLVADGRVVGEGFHRGAGTPHAEVDALSAAGSQARGSTAYVSLEPCAHRGRTGPCAQALIAAGVTRVVYATADPSPAAAGGANVLRAAGVRVDQVPVPAAEEITRRWAYAVTHGRPFVTWKVGATLDGRVAAVDGTSRWITGAQARADVHRLRGECGAIVAGTGTVLADDPSLTVRDARGETVGRQPLRVVVGRRQVPDGAAVRGPGEWLHVPDRDPAIVLAALHERQVRHVLVEGGPTLAASWLGAGVVDEVIAYLAPTLLGSGPSVVADLGVSTLSSAIHLELVAVSQVGGDVRLVLRPCRPNTVLSEGVSSCSPE